MEAIRSFHSRCLARAEQSSSITAYSPQQGWKSCCPSDHLRNSTSSFNALNQKHFLLLCYTAVHMKSFLFSTKNGFFFSSMIDHSIKQKNCYISAVPLARHIASRCQIQMVKSPCNYWNHKQDFGLLKGIPKSTGDPSALPSPALLPLMAVQHFLYCNSSSLIIHSCRLASGEKGKKVPAAIAVEQFWMENSTWQNCHT